jgi:Carboxypeptidase regulatory-like domain/TonB dependent receptor
MNSTSKIVAALLLAFLWIGTAFGQGSASGDLHVIVKDEKGSFVTSATVTVREQAKATVRATTLNTDGVYRIVSLPPGVYTVTVEAPGFAKAEAKDQSLTVGQMKELPITLNVSGVETVVNVSSEADLVETSRSSATDTIDQRRIDNLPINGRNYINFAQTDSQVVRDNAPNTGAAPTSGLNFGGQRARSNLVNVDGADATDNSTNGVRSTVSQEAVQEFQIITNGYAAEYGRASGGVVNIITRSGSNDFHGDVFGYLRNRNFQAVNPFAVCLNPPCPNPAYTRVQAGVAFGGPIKKDKTYYYFSYEITRRHETGFSSIGQNNFGLTNFDASPFFGAPAGSFQILATSPQAGFLQQFASAPPPPLVPFLQQYSALVGAASGMAVNGAWPLAMGGVPGFFSTCQTPGTCFVPKSYQTLASQEGNFPVFEGTSLYSLRIDHNISNNNRLMLRGNVSPSTVTGIEVGGQSQPFGQNAYSRTSEQTYRDVAGTVQDTWTLGNNKVNEFRFQYARRGLSYFFNTAIPGGADPAVNIPGFAYFGREPYSYIQRTEQRYQFSDSFSWAIGAHDTKFGADFNYLPLKAIFTVNYGGVFDFGGLRADQVIPSALFGLLPPSIQQSIPDFSAVQTYGLGIPGDFIQGIGSPSDTFSNKPLGLFWQDSWRVRSNVTLNLGIRYDVEFPPKFKPPQGLALPAYNLLGLQKGIQTDKNNFQPRVGIAYDPKGDGKTVIRASYGMFYDHPLLGLYFLGDASDGSSSGQLAFGGTSPCSGVDGDPGNLNGIPIFQGSLNQPGCKPSPFPLANANLGYQRDQQQFQALNFPQSVFLSQNYLNLDPDPTKSTFLPLGFQPFGYPQAKNFVYAYSQQAHVAVERDLGGGYALTLAYNFNGGRHLNRPINANTIRGDLMVANFNAALAAGQTPASPFTVGSGGGLPCGSGPLGPWVSAPLMNFFRPGGMNPSIAVALVSAGAGACVDLAQSMENSLASQGFNANCDPATYTNCVPFGDMDANYSNGSSIYHGFSANLRKRFSRHYEFLASYTFSHSIDDSTDLQSTLTPQDSYYPGFDRSNSLFDQRHRFVFSGVYQTGKVGSGFGGKFLSDWTFAPVIEVASGRPFNIITGTGDNLQLSSLTSRPNTFVDPACATPVPSKYSPTGTFQEVCINGFAATGTTPTLLQLDGNFGRNAAVAPWTVFDDLRVAKRINFNERFNMDLIADMFNIANKFNVSAVSPLFTNAGTPTAAYDPRQFQFAIKINW